MIELEQIKTTEKLGNIRPLINTALGEIQQDQPFVGMAVNPSINFFDNGALICAITASALSTQRLYALCFPESNGIFVAKFYGTIMFVPPANARATSFTIDIPSIKIPTRDSTISTFVSPKHLGLLGSEQEPMRTGVSVFNFSLMFDAEIVQHDTTCNINGTNTRGGAVAPSIGLTEETTTYLTLL